jgi:RimJ/RimL family protein N-acetyltransferase
MNAESVAIGHVALVPSPSMPIPPLRNSQKVSTNTSSISSERINSNCSLSVSENQFGGTVNVPDNSNDSSVLYEIGFLLSKRYWRQGIAQEAVTALLKYAFKMGDLNDRMEAKCNATELSGESSNHCETSQRLNPLPALTCVCADVDPRNVASLSLLAKLGFREYARAEGTFVILDVACDSVYLVLEASDFVS